MRIFSPARAALLTCIILLTTANVLAQTGPVSRSRQTLLVLTDDWNSRRGEMRLFERTSGGPWIQNGPVIPVVLGFNGLGWGLGLHDDQEPGPVKREGDGRSVAGIFPLGSAFGSDPPGRLKLKIPYEQMTKDFECVDDPASSHYNQVLDTSGVPERDWRSSEQMLHDHDGEYRLGVEVEHNLHPSVPGGGSCIFLHVWHSPTARTTGCTAMSLTDMERVAAWLDPDKRPLMAQYPESERERFARMYGLP
jgi:L,D-peptidoglycan transpeptidase YkuD (ErfK/YbiS/YcfS/YnhG family)